MLKNGTPYKRIVAIVGCSPATISYHAKRIGLSKGRQLRYDWASVQNDLDRGMTVRQCSAKHGFSKAAYCLAVKAGRLKPKKKISEMTIGEVLDHVSSRKTSSYERLQIRRALWDGGHHNKCDICGIKEWNGSQITLEVDHINGNPRDNSVGNLRLLCPNCHSSTDTWRGRNARR